MKNLTGESMNITEENLKAMQQLFPEAFEEGKIDFDVLRQLLGEFVDDEQERYSFKWNGKGRALRLSQTPSMGTLRPCKEESKDWDTTENLYIEGDNLEVLKLLQKSYYGKVKMIYIDPPYNTGGDFVYKDNFHDNIQNYKEITGQVDGEGNKIDTNTEANGRFHTDWLNMMYPRLRLARNLLADDGAICISIDDNELDDLRKICNEIFGEISFRNMLLTRRRTKSLNSQFADNGLNSLNVGAEYIFVYAKNSFLMKAIRSKKENASNKGRWDVFWSNADRPTMRYDILGFTPTTGQWRNAKEKADKAVENYKVYEDKYSSKMTLEEYYAKTGISDFIRRIPNGTGKNGGVQHWIAPSDTILRTSNWTDIEVSQIGKEIDIPFDNPKNKLLIVELMRLVDLKSDDIIMDFFSGSSTTAHAVMQLNNEDGCHRKFIMVQLPESTSEDSEAAKAGYKNICEIGKERIRRAGEKIKAEARDKAADLDIGFKVFKLDSSNLQKWNPQPDDLVMTLQQSTDNFLPDRTEQDVLYEIMLKMGLVLTCQIEEEQAAGETVYIIGGGALMICLGRNITTAVAEAVVKLHEEYESELWQVVFRDTGFASDMDKTNVKETLKAAGLDEDSFVCV
ncbi:site-specific DNA-methyltransferase [Selenomonas ruminantium]|uniref:Adenine-specific DNA-methyltransferase n=1 Tax=Selenomonas ruminantium TaxID=971 RepID=A0A1H0UDV6_SELRU|nr:site-specific DNA-methyltransferase [Selenomonas ruminantium]SDP64354.1 adenine-specific DNA-methyltransferase [Selenomonas ruminantium]